ncbi:hypothetical protein LOAG_03941 [Loa loa]|uniref:Uncharacterized protein n=1 Tax=Loa loa TaxID=7209 RepID=A0A1S0U3A0_LOALO|nr:hypothetical protein LOAG_03941 [Loa loa]EFO24544.1 hypothetical protein LOAG_03941 [Loa loa]
MTTQLTHIDGHIVEMCNLITMLITNVSCNWNKFESISIVFGIRTIIKDKLPYVSGTNNTGFKGMTVRSDASRPWYSCVAIRLSAAGVPCDHAERRKGRAMTSGGRRWAQGVIKSLTRLQEATVFVLLAAAVRPN